MIWLALLLPLAEAKVYPTELDVADESDLRRLVADEILSDDEFTTLVDLLESPIDVNYASSNQLFDLPSLPLGLCRRLVSDRKKNGPFLSLDDMVRVEGVTEDMIDQLRPFAIAGARLELTGAKVGVHLRSRIAAEFVNAAVLADDHPERTHTARQLGYDNLPRGYLSAKVDYGRWIEGGFLGLMTEGLYAAKLTPETGQIHAEWGRPLLDFGKAYVQVQRSGYKGLLGSYTTGFGLGTVFDRTTRDRPNGIYEDLIVTGVDGDFRVRKSLFGLAGELADLDMGVVDLSATVFASMSPQDVYQYRSAYLLDADADPYEDALSPRVYIEDKEGEWQKLGYATLPNAFREELVGGNVTVHIADHTDIGATAYAGQVKARTSYVGSADDAWRLRLRNGYDANVFGAGGVFVGTHLGPVDAMVEYGRSFDNSENDGRGGNAVQAQAILTQPWGTVEGSFRYYETGYDNPNASGTANADQYHGQRDRDEVGGKLETALYPVKWFKIRAWGDLWHNLRLRRTNGEFFARADVTPVDGWRISFLGNTRNRNLAVNDRTRIYGGDYSEVYFISDSGAFTAPDGSAFVDGAGARHYWAAETRVTAIPLTTLTAFYRRSYEDIGRYYPNSGNPCEPWYMIGHYMWLRADVRPLEGTQISTRIRYRDDDIYGSRDDEFIEAYLQIAQELPGNVKLRLRGTLGSNLDDATYPYREACAIDRTAADPYPELDETIYVAPGLYGWVWLAAEWRF